MGTTYNILTTYPEVELSNPVRDDYPELRFTHRPAPSGAAPFFLRAYGEMLTRNRDAVLIEGAREAFIYSFAKLLTLNVRTKIIGNLMYFQTPSQRFPANLLQRFKIAVIAKGVSRLVIISTKEIDSYHELLGIPREKMTFVPYKMNSREFLEMLPVTEGNHIYAGGDSIRDYPTLFNAVRGLDIRVKVLTHLTFDEGSVPKNVEIVRNSNTPKEYYGPCASSLFVVLPIHDGYIRSSAQGTYLGSMFLKKAVIVSEIPGVHDHIKNGETGLVVPAGNSDALREKIVYLVNNPDERRRIGQQAHEAVRTTYTLEQFLDNLFKTTKDAIEQS